MCVCYIYIMKWPLGILHMNPDPDNTWKYQIVKDT